MAIDSRTKRHAFLAWSTGSPLPIADGTIDAADRIHFLGSYGGNGLPSSGGSGSATALLVASTAIDDERERGLDDDAILAAYAFGWL